MMEGPAMRARLAALRHNRIHTRFLQDHSFSNRGRGADDLCAFGFERLHDRWRWHAKSEAEDRNLQLKKHLGLFSERSAREGSRWFSEPQFLVKRCNQCQRRRDVLWCRREFNSKEIYVERLVSQLPCARHHLPDLLRSGISCGQRSQAARVGNRSRHLRRGCSCHGRLNDGITQVKEGSMMIAAHKALLLL